MGDAIAQAIDGAPSRSTSLLAVASSVAKEPNSCRLLSLKLRSQGWVVLTQHRQHFGATGAGVGDGARHGSGGPDG